MACELHLGVESGKADEELAAGGVEAFLKNEAAASASGEGVKVGGTAPAAGGGGRLYLWKSPDGGVRSALDRLPRQRAGGSGGGGGGGQQAPSVASDVIVLVCHGQPPGEAIVSRRQLQCLTLASASAAVAEGEDGKEAPAVDGDGGSGAASTEKGSPAAVLQALQLYAQSFLPTLSGVVDEENANVLADKIRQLSVALQQTSRSARLPHVELAIHPVIRKALESRGAGGGKIDLETLGLADKVRDDDFLNSLQAGVSRWITQIRTLTVLPGSTPFAIEGEGDSPAVSQAAADEVAFWTQLNSELISIQQQLKSEPGVEVTLALLREAKRFVATLALENNTGLDQAVAHTQEAVNFLKPFPLQQLQTARDWEKLAMAVTAVFEHLPKVRTTRHYSLERACTLLEATTAVLRDSLLAVLQEQYSNFLFIEYKDYERKVHFPLLNVFVEFDDHFAVWKNFVLEHGKRRKIPQGQLNKALERMTFHHAALRERLEVLHEFRQSHHELRQVVSAVLRQDDPAVLQSVEQAPRQIMGGLAVLELSQGGKQALDRALEEYDLQMDVLEERLAKLLCDKLTACQVGAVRCYEGLSKNIY